MIRIPKFCKVLLLSIMMFTAWMPIGHTAIVSTPDGRSYWQFSCLDFGFNVLQSDLVDSCGLSCVQTNNGESWRDYEFYCVEPANGDPDYDAQACLDAIHALNTTGCSSCCEHAGGALERLPPISEEIFESDLFGTSATGSTCSQPPSNINGSVPKGPPSESNDDAAPPPPPPPADQ